MGEVELNQDDFDDVIKVINVESYVDVEVLIEKI